MNLHTAITDRTLIHKYFVKAITDRPAAHEHVRSLTAISFPSLIIISILVLHLLYTYCEVAPNAAIAIDIICEMATPSCFL